MRMDAHSEAEMTSDKEDRVAGKARRPLDCRTEVAHSPLYLEDLRDNRPEGDTTLNVLCVEDDPFHQKVLSSYFDAANRVYEGALVYSVTMVDTAAKALEAVSSLDQQPDLILVDIMLEDSTGDELLSELRKTLKPEVAIVMASQLSDVNRKHPNRIAPSTRYLEGIPFEPCTSPVPTLPSQV
jgi:CheY-like chemotaxis protein